MRQHVRTREGVVRTVGLRVSYAPPEGVRIELICHLSLRGVLCGVATWASTWAFGGGLYNAPLLTWLFCQGRKDGLQMMHLNPWLLFGVDVPSGAVEGGVFMASHRSWGDFQAACRFDSDMVGRLVVWSTEELCPLNMESSPRNCIFPSAPVGPGSFVLTVGISLCRFRLGPTL